jgi:hypothetical protein
MTRKEKLDLFTSPHEAPRVFGIITIGSALIALVAAYFQISMSALAWIECAFVLSSPLWIFHFLDGRTGWRPDSLASRCAGWASERGNRQEGETHG